MNKKLIQNTQGKDMKRRGQESANYHWNLLKKKTRRKVCQERERSVYDESGGWGGNLAELSSAATHGVVKSHI